MGPFSQEDREGWCLGTVEGEFGEVSAVEESSYDSLAQRGFG